MISANKIKEHYNLTSEEEQILKDLHPVMRQHRDRFSEDFYNYVMSHTEMAEFFHEKEKVDRHRMLMAAWFMRLFKGTYDEGYFGNLRHVGKVHVNIKLDGHFVNSAMARVRHFLTEVIDAHVSAPERESTLVAVNKMLDINLDVLTSSYRQAELKKYFVSYRLESNLINYMERFTHGLNLILCLALGLVSLAVVGLFGHDIYRIFTEDKVETAIIAALGSMLIIWMMIELLDTEVSHLKGKKIPIKIFVGVVIVAFIRKVLISSLAHENILDYTSKIATLFILGLVYWLVTRADRT